MTPNLLTIAGSDPIGGAGVQADIKTIHALGGYAFSALTAINAQNFDGVQAVYPLPQTQVADQLSALQNVPFDAIKIGQLANAEIVESVADYIATVSCPVILDPVMISSSGRRLLEATAQPGLVTQLLPRVSLITPNIPEVNALLNTDYRGLESEMADIGQGFAQLGVQAVLVKGGHSDEHQACDYLLYQNQILRFCSPRIEQLNVKGTGCALSSAIACFVAQGQDLKQSVAHAKAYLSERLTQKRFVTFHQAWSLDIIDPFAHEPR